MKTKTTTVYEFKELPENVQQKVLDKYYDINVGHEWWEFTFEDAKNVGLKITGFGLDRDRHADGEFLLSANEVAANIFRDHGEDCQTYKTAASLGYTVDEDAMFTQFGTGGISYGQTKRSVIPVLQNGKPILDKRGKEANRGITVVIYRMDNGMYELVKYKTW